MQIGAHAMQRHAFIQSNFTHPKAERRTAVAQVHDHAPVDGFPEGGNDLIQVSQHTADFSVVGVCDYVAGTQQIQNVVDQRRGVTDVQHQGFIHQ